MMTPSNDRMPQAPQATHQSPAEQAPCGQSQPARKRQASLSRAFIARLIERHREALERLAER